MSNNSGAPGLSDSIFIDLQKDTRGFEKLSNVLKQKAGIHLPTNPKNMCLMASRLGPVLRRRGYTTYAEYHRFVEQSSGLGLEEFICALTTNTTQFFRESKHFDILRAQLPELLKAKAKTAKRELRVWCAAASTGQEPYTLAMAIHDCLDGGLGWDVKILATDIDAQVLQKASRGIYSEAEIASLPALYRQKLTRQIIDGKERAHQIVPALANWIRFAPFNLLSAPYPFKFPFDVVFCRNVLIYFDTATSTAVVSRLASTLASGGLLFLGHSESGAMKTAGMKQLAPAAYQRISASKLVAA